MVKFYRFLYLYKNKYLTMAKKNKNDNYFKQDYNEELKYRLENEKLLNKELNSLNSIYRAKERIAVQEKLINEYATYRNQLENTYQRYIKDNENVSENTKKAYEDQIKNLSKILDKQKKIKNTTDKISKGFKAAFSTLKGIGKFLMDNDKIIRRTNLELGFSNQKAADLRQNFYESGRLAARLGGDLKDVQKVMTGYANETGRARALSSDLADKILLMGKGTALGVENAAKLAGQFELIGLGITTTSKFVEDTMNQAETMGLNGSRILKKISENFSKLQNTTFNKGIEGMKQMAMYAEKAKINMSEMLSAAERSRGLDNIIEMSASLQVLGGEFAKTDPMRLLFQARNAPQEFQKSLNKMVKGVATFRKNIDGVFEAYISPADIDRLHTAEKAIGLTNGELVKQAYRMADIQKIKGDVYGLGLDKKMKEFVENQAVRESKSGKYYIELMGVKKEISQLSRKDVESYMKIQKTLEERAKTALAFDESWKALINEFKTIMLPILDGLNWALDKIIKLGDWINGLFDKGSKIGAYVAGGIVLAIGTALKLFTLSISSIFKARMMRNALGGILNNPLSTGNVANPAGVLGGGGITQTQAVGGGTFNNTVGNIGGTTGGATGGGMNYGKMAKYSKAEGYRMRGAALNKLAVGGAAVGIGAGIGIAAVGIGKLAQAIKDVDVEKLQAMNVTLGLLGGTMILTLVPATFALGTAGEFAAPGLLAFGAAALMVGGAIGAASWGIGQMADGFSKLITSIGKYDIGWSLLQVAAGIAAINVAMATTGIMGGVGSFLGGGSVIKDIADNASALKVVGAAFKEINQAVATSPDDWARVEKAVTNIGNADLSNLKNIAELKNILSKPLKVQLDTNGTQIRTNITLEIDGKKLIEALPIVSATSSKKIAIGNGKNAENTYSYNE